MYKIAVWIMLVSSRDGNEVVVTQAWEGNVPTFTLEVRMYLP